MRRAVARCGVRQMIGASGLSRATRNAVAPEIGVGHHRLGADGVAHLAGRRGDRIRGDMFGLAAARLDHCAPARVLFHARDDAVHHVHRLERILSRRRLRRQHDGVCAVEHRRCDIGGLRPGWRWGAYHAFQHLRRHHDRFAQLSRRTYDALLRQGHFLGRQLHPEIAARHHHRVGQLHDGLEVLQRLRLLQLHHHPGTTADKLLRLCHVLCTLHE